MFFYKEIEEFKSSLQKMYSAHNKKAVFYERNYKSQHLQIQVVPVPNNVAPNLKDAFLVCSSIFKSKFIQKDRYLTLLIYYALVFFLINL